MVLLVAFGVGASLFTTLIGVAYPTFKSIIALETPSAEDDKQWLTYWCIFGFLSVIDDFGCCILNYIPYYYFIKVCILIWLFNPATQGASVLYNKVVSPLLKKYDAQIQEFSKMINEVYSDVANLAAKKQQ